MLKCMTVYPWEIIAKLREGKHVKCFDMLNDTEYTLPDMLVYEMFDLIEEVDSCAGENRFIVWYTENIRENEEDEIDESTD